MKAIDARDHFYLDERRERGTLQRRSVQVNWADPEVYKAFLALEDADSITVDPHKMSYIPYPAGVIVFRNSLVAELMTQRAQYISETRQGIRDIKSLDEPLNIQAVGPHILEGSKPGAAATSCWLAHRTIPLTATGHGRIVRTTVLNAKKLVRLLHSHKHLFRDLSQEHGGVTQSIHPFTFCAALYSHEPLLCRGRT